MPKLFYFSLRHEITWTVNLKPMNYSEEVIVWETGLNIEQRCSDFEVILVCPPWDAGITGLERMFIYANARKQVIQNVGSI